MLLCGCISETVAEVQFGGMEALAPFAISFSSGAGEPFGQGDHGRLNSFDQAVYFRFDAPPSGDNQNFSEGGGGDQYRRFRVHGRHAVECSILVLSDGHQRRCVDDDQAGRPFSSYR